MASKNRPTRGTGARTYEGAPAIISNAKEQLERAIMACLLWEDGFYENGESIADRICNLVASINDIEWLHDLAIRARTQSNLRHAPLLLAREIARKPNSRVSHLLPQIILRADELTEFLSIYWLEGRTPISAQVKKGLAHAFRKFDAYQLAKYDRDKDVRLRDVLFMCHAKPVNEQQAETWKKLVDGTLEAPDTWEVALSGGSDKRETFTRLLREKKLGALALLRNLRNMNNAGVSHQLIKQGIVGMRVDRVLPFRFIAAARHAPMFEPDLERKMYESIGNKYRLHGTVAVLVDVSGSMDWGVSGKSDINNIDVACGLAAIVREVADDVRVFSFSNSVVEVPLRRGFALMDAVNRSQHHHGTDIGGAVDYVNERVKPDVCIVITDEQSHTHVGRPHNRGYIINVATYDRGVGYGPWTHINGWSESVVKYILYMEDVV